MKTTWNDRQGHRDCQAHCLLVTMDGEIHRFGGGSIDGVCHAVELDHEKNGKWSNSTWEITHAETTAVVTFRDSWDMGYMFPQKSWDEGYFWLAEQAPMLTREGFERFIRAKCPNTAARWDKAAKAEQEFGFAATEEEVARIQEAAERIRKEKDEYDRRQAEARANSPFAVLANLKLEE